MREECRLFHNDVLSLFNSIMYDSLVHNFNITTDSIKSFVFEMDDTENPESTEPLRGFLAMKEHNNTKIK